MSAQFDERAVYSREDLQAMLGDAVSVETFLENLHVPRRFKYLVLGSDIVRALQNPPGESGREEYDRQRAKPEAHRRTPKAKPSRPGLRPIRIDEILTEGRK